MTKYSARKVAIASVVVGAVIVFRASPSAGATVSVSLIPLSGSIAEGTAIFRADLSTIGISEVRSITLTDSNSMSGGSRGEFSGFDLDAIALSNSRATEASELPSISNLDVFDFSPNRTAFVPGTQRPPEDRKLFGTDASGSNVDADLATLNLFDAAFFESGYVTLGDGGRIEFLLSSAVSTTDLYLYVGEVSGDPGEMLSAAIEISNIPEPSTLVLLVLGLVLTFSATARSR